MAASGPKQRKSRERHQSSTPAAQKKLPHQSVRSEFAARRNNEIGITDQRIRRGLQGAETTRSGTRRLVFGCLAAPPVGLRGRQPVPPTKKPRSAR
jgi:hypothetical protein